MAPTNAVCIGSGPSLTTADCEIVKQSGFYTIACNNTWEAAPFCNAIYARDYGWWKAHGDNITIKAERWTRNHRYRLEEIDYVLPSIGNSNSGADSIRLAMHKGAKNILLLAVDCSLAGGIHHHGPHTKTNNPEQKVVDAWKEQFRLVADMALAYGARVINCSRYTELACFEQQDLEAAISDAMAESAGNRHRLRA